MSAAGVSCSAGASALWRVLAASCWVLVSVVVSGGNLQADVFVSTTGDDANAGSERAPVRTLERARDIVRVQRRSSAAARGDLSVWIRGGTYALSQTFHLGPEDSGSSGRRIVYRAIKGDDPPLLAGGRSALHLDHFDAIELADGVAPLLRNRLWKAQLPEAAAYQRQSVQGIGVGLAAVPAPPELSCGLTALEYVHAPRTGWYSIDAAMSSRAAFTTDVNINRWQLSSAWLHGYWGHEWADALVPVRSGNSAAGTVAVDPFPPGLFSYAPGSRWQLVNVPELLGNPGEYFIDFERNTAYLMLPDHCAPGALTISTLTQPVISVERSRYLAFEGLSIGAARGDGLVISGADHVWVSRCLVRDVGGVGIAITGGYDNRVMNSQLTRIGRSAILVGGGDRATLAPAGHRIEANDIHDYGRWVGAYSAGVDIYGVGVHVVGNRIHAAPHNAIKLSGNDHTIEENEIFEVARDTGDVGAIYAGRNLFMRGNVIRRNFLHDNGSGIPGGVSGVYLDDMFSGVTIEANVFVRSGQCVFIGGGRDNIVTGNLFVGCEPAVHTDDRGISTHASLARQSRRQGGWGLLDERDQYLKSAVYTHRYPGLVGLAGEHSLEPSGNRIVGNVVAEAQSLTNAGVPLNANWFRFTANSELAGLLTSSDIDTIRRQAATVPALHALYFGALAR